MKLVAIVLTLNEERHLRRCLSSLQGVVDGVFVVDCFSTDKTCFIAKEMGATVLQREWINHATQFNWALSQLEDESSWVLRIDADEFITPDLANEIREKLPNVDTSIDGIVVSRRMNFLGKPIRFGGVFPIRVLRLFRLGRGECENRWMDEHIKVSGPTANFHGEIVDDNLNSLTWWTDKHNKYASREAVDLLNLEYGFMPHDSVAELSSTDQAGLKRWLKEKVYSRLPGGFRAAIYFFYRYFIHLGFLDGRHGTTFHVLQGFWYRYLVDEKVAEVKSYITRENEPIEVAIDKVLGIKI